MIGQPVTATITVTNPGDGPADNVTILSKLSEGLGHEKGKQVSYELGGLAAGETRNVQIVLNTVKGGPQMVQAHAAADGGLESHAESKTAVTEPKLEIVAQGPKLRYLDRQATYTVAVANPGTAPANNIKATAVVPAGFKFVECSPGGRYDHSTRTISWFIGSVKNGDKAEVNYRCQAVNAGNFKHVVAASGQYGLKGETEVATAVQVSRPCCSRLLMSMIRLRRVLSRPMKFASPIRVHPMPPTWKFMRWFQRKWKSKVAKVQPSIAWKAKKFFSKHCHAWHLELMLCSASW